MQLRPRVNTIVACALIAMFLIVLGGIGKFQVGAFICFDVCPPRDGLFIVLSYFLIGFLPGALFALIACLLCVSILPAGMRRLRIALLATPVIIAALLAVLAQVGYNTLPVNEGGGLIERGIEGYLALWIASVALLLIAWASETAWLARRCLTWSSLPEDGDAGADSIPAG